MLEELEVAPQWLPSRRYPPYSLSYPAVLERSREPVTIVPTAGIVARERVSAWLGGRLMNIIAPWMRPGEGW